MKDYFEVKPKKKTWIIAICIPLFILIVGSFLDISSAVIISFIFLILVYLTTKNDRILYNTDGIVLFSPLGKRFCYSWDQVEVYVQFEKVHRSINMQQILNITYTFCYSPNGKSHTETMKKVLKNYNGAMGLVLFYESKKQG